MPGDVPGDVPRGRAELEEFVASLRADGAETGAIGDGMLDPSRPLGAARAPGRLDVMGGIADYSGSLVLQWPIAEAALAAAQRADDGTVRAASLSVEPGDAPRRFAMPAGEFARLAAAGDEALGDFFRARGESAWVAYVLGPVAVWARRRGVDLGDGLRIVVRSRVPEAKGVSSSAAIEVASLRAAAELFGDAVSGAELAHLCQAAENHVVGAPCGIMDQMASALGRAGELLALLCQPADVKGYVPLPPEIRFWGIDSGIRHAVSGADYTGVRTGAFMGYRIIAELAGLPATGPDASGRMTIDDPRWHGYLANLSLEDFDGHYAWRLPETMRGDEFLARYGGTTDAATRVDPAREYTVLRPTAHPVHEHRRVARFAELLRSPLDEASLVAMGALMYASHASYSACGLGSDGTDRLVAMVREAGPAAGLFGAKITGGGSGGTVAVLGRAEAAGAVAEIAARYAEQTGRQTTVFAESSDGACCGE